MRNRYIYFIIFFLLFILHNPSSFAITYSIGVKVWAVDITTDFEPKDIETDGFLYGPNLYIRSNHLFGGLSASFGTLEGDWEYYDSSYDIDYDFELELERKDVDIFAGYVFDSGFGILVGYKLAELTIKIKDEYYGLEDEGDNEVKGPVVGLNYGGFISDTNFMIFGNLCYGKLKDDDSYDVDAGFLEVGVGFKFPSSPLSVTVSYKYHNYEYEDNSEEEYAGVCAGVNYLLGN